MIADAELILRVCGVSTYLHIGCGQSTLVFELLKRTIDAYGIDASPDIISNNLQRAPQRFVQGNLINYPFKPETFDTIVLSEEILNFNNDDTVALLKVLRQMTKHNLVLYFPTGVTGKVSLESGKLSRLFWERAAIAAGFRRHTREMLATPYDALENEQLGRLTFFERVPEAALERFPHSWLLENRDLHMDMLREAGRRSDGHVSRYALAATRIRPGDVVLDAACGLGYGSAVMAACSPGARFIGVDIDADSIAYAKENFAAVNPSLSYHASDVTNLSFIADHSIDAVISFETIEHLTDYDAFLSEVARVLKPDGRFLGCVPNQWCDETGKDPNPYHFHVFNWEKLNAAIAKYFIVDGRWAQTAGGGYKMRDAKREMVNIPLNLTNAIETEWWIISASANPSLTHSTPYTNPFQTSENNNVVPVHVSFEKYYDNPWLYRVMVQLGERLSDQNVLLSFCGTVIQSAKTGSADQGAALCVIAYQLLESGNVTLQSVATIARGINEFDQAFDRNNPHAFRWAVSLHYVGGRLLLALGNRDDALTNFLTCADMDPLNFSPLLATKTISSRMYAGLILAGNGDLEAARKQFRLGVKEAHRVLQGDWKNLVGTMDDPLLFGLPEAAEVLDIASQCAQALKALERQTNVPGYFWDKINLKRFGMVEWNKSLERENMQLRQLVAQH
ncbi:MAG: class I SAM-dependent methyltransferase [Gammaproteobacteria bacterium]